ncbi:MAG TPA: EamA family transporter [Blastocatellia bacterium]|nr:EamA family transporter [Blastocatellia bacterium]
MRNFVVLSLVVLFQVVGNVFLSRGMRSIPPIDRVDVSTVTHFGLQAAASPFVLLGVALLVGFFVMYLTALSRLELSYVLPMTASTYVLTALLAWLALGESVSSGRWIGTMAVSVGILLVGESERRKKSATESRTSTSSTSDPVMFAELEPEPAAETVR